MTRASLTPGFAAFAAALALLSVAGQAQVLKGHDSNAPVNFSADRIEVQDRADRVVVTGNVVVDQAGLHLTAARMTVAYSHAANAGGGTDVEIERIDASGNVVVTRGSDRASGNVAIYDLNTRLITMLGNVQLNQGANRLTGGRLVMDLNSGRSTVDGRSAGAPGTATGASGRVSGTFTVPQRSGK
jgi:lipopolysaccharide export system protein LptA